jgi:DNA-binding MarR family transcriptional regulator
MNRGEHNSNKYCILENLKMNQVEEIFNITLSNLTQHIGNISFNGEKIGRRIFIINYLGLKNKCNMTDIVENLSLPKSTATRQVDYLVKRHLINRKIPDNNRRTVELTLSSNGNDLYKWFQDHLKKVTNSILRVYPENEIEIIFKIIKQMIEYSEKFLKESGHWR